MAREWTRPVYLSAVVPSPANAGMYIVNQYREGADAPADAVYCGAEIAAADGAVILSARNGWVARYTDEWIHDDPESRIPAEKRHIMLDGMRLDDPDTQHLRRYAEMASDTAEIAARPLPWE